MSLLFAQLADALENTYAYTQAQDEAVVIERCAQIAESSAVHHNGIKVGIGIAAAIRTLVKETA